MCENVGGRGAGDLLQVLMQELAFSVPVKKQKNKKNFFIYMNFFILIFKICSIPLACLPKGGGGGEREKHIYIIYIMMN